MDALLKPLPIVALLAGIALLALGHIEFGVAALIAWVGVVAIGAMRAGAEQRVADPAEELDAESRTLLTPIRRLVTEIEEVVAANQRSATVKVVGGEAVREARRIRDQAAKALGVRSELKRALRARSLAEKNVEDLSQRMQEAQTPEERSSLEDAAAARKAELEHYDSLSSILAQIDASLLQAKASLAEMKARLSTSAGSEKAELADTGELRDAIGSLKALSLSYDEAEQMLRQ